MNKSIQIQVPIMKTPVIKLLWEDGREVEVPILSLIRGVMLDGKRPSGFYYDKNQPTYNVNREKFLEWAYEQLKPCFDSEAFSKHMSILEYKG